MKPYKLEAAGAGVDLVTLDLDGTLVRTTVFLEAAKGLGMADRVEAYDEHYFRGTLSLEATFYAEYKLFLGTPVEEVHRALEQGTWVEGIAETVETLRRRGTEVWVVTDQPSWAVSYLERFGIIEGVWTACATRGGRVGAVRDQVFDKWPPLQHRLKEANIPPERVCHVGNGANDIPVWDHVGQGIAFNPSGPEVAARADAVVEGGDLRDILAHL